jgi:V/A-type H+-transporting ATPase subunit I
MSKLTLLGLEEEKKELLKSLMEFGAVEISDVNKDDYDEVVHQPVIIDELQKIEADISDIDTSLGILDKYCPEKKGLFYCRRQITTDELNKALKNKDKIWENVNSIKHLEESLNAIKSEENKLNNIYLSLQQWKELPFPLQTEGTHKTVFQLGTVPSAVDLRLVEAELQERVPYSFIGHVYSDADMHYIYLVCHKDMEQECFSYMKTQGYNRIMFAGLKGTASENIELINDDLKMLEIERNNSIEEIKALKDCRSDIEILYDMLCMERDRVKAVGNILATKKAFLIKGWIPEKVSQGAKKWLESKYTVSIELEEPSEAEEFPVLLENKGIAEVGEPVSGMYSLPNSREIDPNAVMAPFFIMFFGLMLSDGGYGIIMVLVSAFILWRVKLEENMHKFMKLMLYGGIATVFWGIMFGSWFGIESLSKYNLWLNPVEKPELLLSWSLLFGIIHMYAGFALKAANLIRQKQYLDAVYDVGFRLIFYTGFILILLPYAPEVDKAAVAPLVTIGKYMMIIGAVLNIFTQGRDKKNIIMKILGGVLSLYDVVGFMSDVLSYSRLLALGLATGIIASIVNTMSAMFEFPMVIKVLLMAIILLVGHVINFAINALGAYVHSCRLQYLEFFGKFFTGGGQPFKPLKANTRYIRLKPNTEI